VARDLGRVRESGLGVIQPDESEAFGAASGHDGVHCDPRDNSARIDSRTVDHHFLWAQGPLVQRFSRRAPRDIITAAIGQGALPLPSYPTTE